MSERDGVVYVLVFVLYCICIVLYLYCIVFVLYCICIVLYLYCIVDVGME